MRRLLSRRSSSRFFSKGVPGDTAEECDSSVLEARQIDIAHAHERWAGTERVSGVELSERYTTHEFLGEGAFGEVSRVVRNSDGAVLAVKAIDKGGGSASDWERAHAEAATWALVSSPYHPSILPLIEVLEVAGTGLHLVT